MTAPIGRPPESQHPVPRPDSDRFLLPEHRRSVIAAAEEARRMREQALARHVGGLLRRYGETDAGWSRHDMESIPRFESIEWRKSDPIQRARKAAL